MSKYFQTLRRLESKRRPAAEPPSLDEAAPPDSEPADEPADEPRAEPATATGKLALAQAQGELAYTGLLDTLRALRSEAGAPSVVIAGISHLEDIAATIEGLVSQAQLRGFRISVSKLETEGNQRGLATRGGAEDANGSLDLHFSGPPSRRAVGEWLARCGQNRDLVLIEAPPLMRSVDAALLARSCEGLVLVVEPRVTPRDAFEAAIERARASGCTILGLVMTKNKACLPGFLERLLGSYPRTIASKLRRRQGERH